MQDKAIRRRATCDMEEGPLSFSSGAFSGLALNPDLLRCMEDTTAPPSSPRARAVSASPGAMAAQALLDGSAQGHVRAKVTILEAKQLLFMDFDTDSY